MKLIRMVNPIRLKNGKPYKRGIFKCSECGSETEKHYTNGEKAKTCGCVLGNLKHGMSVGKNPSKLYMAWSNMKKRCFNSNNKAYKYYGGRGIIVCDEWNDFEHFMHWALLNGYSERLQIDRIDNNGNYEPNNCRFVTAKINSRNRRSNVLNDCLVLKIKKIYSEGLMSQQKLADSLGLKKHNIQQALNKW